MDEHREEREELAALELEERDDAREAAETRAYWDDAGLEHAERVTLRASGYGATPADAAENLLANLAALIPAWREDHAGHTEALREAHVARDEL